MTLSLADAIFASECRNPNLGGCNTALVGGRGFIYVFVPDGHEVCKVGSAICVSSRLRQIQLASWVRLDCAAAVAVMDVGTENLEFPTHRVLRERGSHAMGEWFNVSAQTAIETIIEVARERDIRLASVTSLMAEDRLSAQQRMQDARTNAQEAIRTKLGMV